MKKIIIALSLVFPFVCPAQDKGLWDAPEIKTTDENYLEIVKPRKEFGDPNGLYAIWFQKNGSLLNLPLIRGGQIVFQWKQLETGPGKYDFSALDKQLKGYYDRKLRTSLQVNGNEKPQWLFSKVPVNPKKLSEQVRDKQGTLMYWHPVYQDAYIAFLEALANHLKKSPYKEALLGIRLNFDAIGTEHLPVRPEDRPLENWIVPKGGKQGPEWTEEICLAYQNRVFDTYVEKMSPITTVFVRNGLPDELRTGKIKEAFETGKLAWFQTSTEAEPRGLGVERQYVTFMEYCRTGKTLGYAEPWADGWGWHGLHDPHFSTAQQWHYWRLLADLNMGISYIAIYGSELTVAAQGWHAREEVTPEIQEEYRKGLEFASKYAGWHTRPAQAPGAWVAFRQSRFPKAESTGAALEKMTEDYTFLALVQPGKSRGLVMAGPDGQRFGAWARQLEPGDKLSMVLHPEFAKSIEGKKVKVRITYLNRGRSEWSAFWGGKEIFDVKSDQIGKWETVETEIIAPASQNPDSAGKLVEQGMMAGLNKPEIEALVPDITIKAGARSPIFHMIEVVRM